jgi:hypothetical protein
MLFAPRATADDAEALVKFATVRPLEAPLISSVVEALRVTLEEESRLPAPERARVPAEIAVVPVNVLAADSVKVCAPALARFPAPEIAVEMDEFPVAVLIVPVTPPPIDKGRLKAMPLLKIREALPVKETPLVVARGAALAIAIAPAPICVAPV